jgi:hypothetical protein
MKNTSTAPMSYIYDGRACLGFVQAGTGPETKSKPAKKEWRVPRLVEVFYPLKIGSTQDRHNWISAMMLDARLNDRDKVILSRLALHLNLKTGRLVELLQ